jgi:uncharacterized RDD family membrane protein YckC
VPAPENLIIDTPEQIRLEFPLAGVGSRFLALAFDTVLQAGALSVLFGIGYAVRRLGALSPSVAGFGTWAAAALVAAIFLVHSGYFAIFEAMWTGQTPGKRLVGLRVIDVSGRPVTVYAALIRNCIRILEAPGIYAIAIASVLITRRQQRLGDLAAGTVVVHERLEAPAVDTPSGPASASMSSPARLGAHRLAPEEIVLIEGFLRRRGELDSWVRLNSARKIAQRMAATLELGPIEDDERLLEQLAAEYRAVERYR